jgi:hypothetical protein
MTDWSSRGTPGEQAPEELVSVTVLLTSEDVENLDRQAKADRLSVTDCIRRSLAIGHLVWDAQRHHNAKLLLQSPDGELHPLRIPKAPR